MTSLPQQQTMTDPGPELGPEAASQIVTFRAGDQLFGLPVFIVRDILKSQPLAAMPLSPDEVAGSINLRGHVVSVIDLRRRLSMPPAEKPGLQVVVETRGDFFSLLVDSVGEVIDIDANNQEAPPSTLDPVFRAFSTGIYRLESDLIVILNVNELTNLGR